MGGENSITAGGDYWDATDKFGGMDTSMMARMKELEEENRRLKKMYIEEKLKAEIAAEYLAKK
jgi:putative transposase